MSALRYEIVNKIGKGGMSDVFLVRDFYEFRLVAAKILRPHLQSKNEENEFCNLLQNEANVLNSIDHENFPKVFDCGIFEGSFVLFMEFVDGVNLTEVMMRKRLSLEQRVSLVKQLCGIVDILRGRGIWHCDLKPDNLMVCSGLTLKPIDFSLSHLVGGEALKRENMHTPGYCAPEQLKNQVTSVSDVFSAAVITYELITDVHPFGNEKNAYCRDVTHGLYKKADSKLEKLKINADEWYRVFNKAFQANPDVRYQSGEHFYDDLSKCFNTEAHTVVRGAKDSLEPKNNFRLIDYKEWVKEKMFKQFLTDVIPSELHAGQEPFTAEENTMSVMKMEDKSTDESNENNIDTGDC